MLQYAKCDAFVGLHAVQSKEVLHDTAMHGRILSDGDVGANVVLTLVPDVGETVGLSDGT